jgi:hypothetical protein
VTNKDTFQRGVLTGIQFAIAASASLSSHEESQDNLNVENQGRGSTTALAPRHQGHQHRGAVDVFRRYRKDNPVMSGDVSSSRGSIGRG